MEALMDDDRVKGSTKNVKGSMKEGAGKALGDSKLEGEGRAEKLTGKIQNAIGSIRDSFRRK
jgi:uncharacterized protein YjbJ (UPF0337 family)